MSYRCFLYRFVVLACLAVQVNVVADRPNILLIYGDDQGSIDLGCYGVDDLQTPNLDRLASQGIRLTQMYAPAPVCSASRAGLLTGRFPVRAGQPGNGDLPGGETTMAEVFQAAGYRTGHVGKWHLGTSDDQDPQGQGFGSTFGHLGGCIDNYSHFFFWSGPNRHDLYENRREIHRPGEYFPDLMVQKCEQFIDQGANDDEPWLLYWAFNAPHYPYQGTPDWLDKYASLPTPRREYNAFVSTMDESIGKVLNALDQSGQADNTIVIYQPDHGHSTETRAFGGGGNAGPYRGAKFSLFEGGIRVVSLVRYPKQLASGGVHDGFATGCDWLPTLCEWADVPLPGTHLDGVSIARDLAELAAHREPEFYWQFGRGPKAQWAVRQGPWKLIGNPFDTTEAQSKRSPEARQEGKLFLANLESDPSESEDLSSKNAGVVERLSELRSQWISSLP